MYQFYVTRGLGDRSPFSYTQTNWLSGRISSVYEQYLAYKRSTTIKVPSNHLLAEIMSNVTAEFNGDVLTYIQDVNNQVRRIAGPLKLNSAYTRGDIRKNVFYKGINELITLSAGFEDPVDLWWDWRRVSAVRVTAHPVTSLVIFDPIVENTPELPVSSGYAQINVDLGLLMAQWRMYKASFPQNSVQAFIGDVVAGAMMKSHLNVVLFNMVLEAFDIIPTCKVRPNVPFSQPDLDTQALKIAQAIKSDLLNKSMGERAIINTVPVLLSDMPMLEVLQPPAILSMAQTNWVLHSQAVSKTELVLEICKRRNAYDRILPLLARIRRDNIQMVQEGWYINGLSVNTQRYLTDRWMGVLERVPQETFESIDLDLYY